MLWSPIQNTYMTIQKFQKEKKCDKGNVLNLTIYGV